MAAPRDVLDSLTKPHVGDRQQLIDGESVDGISAPEAHRAEVSPLQLETNQKWSHKASQEGLKIVIVSSICFAISVTVALIITIYLGPPQVPLHAGVVSDKEECSALGVELMKKGGSAIDATVATVLCVGILEPETSGIGGGGVMLIHSHKTGRSHVIDFMDAVPSEWTGKAEIDAGSGNAVGIPGLLRGLEQAHKQFGKLSWKEVILKVEHLVSTVATGNSSSSSASDEAAEHEAMSTLLKRVASEGAGAFYSGEVAEEIVKKVQDAGGAMSMPDLDKYDVVTADPIQASFLDMTVETAPIPTDGAILLLMLNIVENLTLDIGSSWNSTEHYHYVIEAMKFAYAERDLLHSETDPKMIVNITSRLISKEYASSLAAQIDDKTHQPSYYADTVDKGPSGDTLSMPKGSSHISVIGPYDDFVSVVVSLNDKTGSGIKTSAGFYLNNNLMNFNSQSQVKPGQRPALSAIPAIVYTTDSPCSQRLAVGAAHGYFTVAGLAEVIINIAGQHMNPNAALNASRIYEETDVDLVIYEDGLWSEVIKRVMSAAGHSKFKPIEADTSLINIVSKVNEYVYGYADPRNVENSAAAY